MPVNNRAPVLILMAKCPVPGQVKTRLMPAMNAERAAQVATILIERSVRLASDAWPGPVWLFAWPTVDHHLFRLLTQTTRIRLGVQSTGDLGEKMANAIGKFTTQGIATAVMGCDVPHCPPDTLRLASELLEHGNNVIGPSMDGGYYLVGLQKCRYELFTDIKWGSNDVLQATLAAAGRAGIEFTRLQVLQDIDRYEDLKHLSHI